MTSRRYSKKLSVDDGASKAASLIFTTEAQRGEVATEFRIISRKDAKTAKKKKKYLSELSVLGALAGEMSESEMFRILENLL
jgi:hypothetical protein